MADEIPVLPPNVHAQGSGSVPDPRPPQPRPAAPPPPPAPRGSAVGAVAAVFLVLILCGVVFVMGGFMGVFVGMVAGNMEMGLIPTVYQKGEGREKIAIIPIEGVIDGSTVTFAHHAVEAVIKDKDIKAIVLRVESPGGGATASDEILHELRRMQKQRNLPVIASYGDYAASGGYYVSCHADYIIAQPTCITGSIGVIAPYVTIEKLLTEKLGVTPEVVTSTAAIDKDTASFLRSWTEKDRQAVRHLLDGVQDQFVSVVAEGRKGKLTAEEAAKVATGLAMLSRDALKAKLIDRIGYLDDAIAEARDRAGLKHDNPPVIIYRPASGLLTEFGVTSGQSGGSASGSSLRIDAAALRKMAAELLVPRRMMIVQP